MQLRVHHTTRFDYSQPVHCDPLTIRLRPREDAFQSLLDFSLDIDPLPAGQSQQTDLEGNIITRAWFTDPIAWLTVTTSSLVETKIENPFAFLLSETAAEFPFPLSGEDADHAALYLRRLTPDPAVDSLAAGLARETEFFPVRFACRLAEHICEQHEKIVRPEGRPWHPAHTLEQGRGSCRDLAVLFVDACRSQQIPARFVSGYVWGETRVTDHELHAWAEIYLPGAGWRGFDPSTGLAVASHHVAVAAGREPLWAAPTSGTFRGSDVRSTLKAEVAVEAVSCSSDGVARAQLQRQ